MLWIIDGADEVWILSIQRSDWDESTPTEYFLLIDRLNRIIGFYFILLIVQPQRMG
jgi:hypothetical protein